MEGIKSIIAWASSFKTLTPALIHAWDDKIETPIFIKNFGILSRDRDWMKNIYDQRIGILGLERNDLIMMCPDKKKSGHRN